MKTQIKIYILIIFNLTNLINLKSSEAQMYWNQAVQFTGVSTRYVSVPNSSSINLTGSFTLEAWVNPANTNNKGVLSKGGALGTALRYAIRITGSRVALSTNGTPRLSSKTTSLIPTNSWSHISTTYNSSSNEFKIYINGVFDTSAVVAGAAPPSNTDSLFIGISGNSTPFNGQLDEVRIWNRELSSTEVSNYMRTSLSTSSGIYSGLVLSMTFQNPVNSSPYSFNDQSGNGNNGNGRNVIQVNQSFKPLHTISQNECVELDGTDDYLAADGTNNLDLSSITLECWIYPRTTNASTLIKKGTAFEFTYNGGIIGKVNGVSMTPGLPVPLNRWSYILFSYDDSTHNYFYSVNGSIYTGTNNAGNVASNTDSLYIGGGPATGDFNGYIDEVRISNEFRTYHNFKDYIHVSTDVTNDPFPSSKNITYGLDGNLVDNANEGGNQLYFSNNARFSHPGRIANQPVSALNHSSSNSFLHGYYKRTPFRSIQDLGEVYDSTNVNSKTPISDINLFVALNHTNSSNLEIVLRAPNGDSVKVFDGQVTNSTDNNLITLFDDQADSNLLGGRYSSFYTTIKPLNNLGAVFNGDIPFGRWKLLVRDKTSSDSGIFYAWGIQLNNKQYRDKNLNPSVLLQGFYDSTSNTMRPDTITFNLRYNFQPFDLVTSSTVFTNTSGTGNCSVSHSGQLIDGELYYLQVLHRNTIESWSNGFIVFTNSESNPNFTLTQGATFGSNSVRVDFSPNRFAFYSGDVNQDGCIDATDLGMIDNDAFNFTTGYVVTDITGDEVVDATDAAIADNNAFDFVCSLTPINF